MTSKYFPLVRLILSLFAALISIGLLVAAIQPLSVAGSPQSQAQTGTERVVEFTIPKHVPIKVKLKREKEKAIKDLRNEKWYQDFQLR